MCIVKHYSFTIDSTDTFANINTQVKTFLKKSKIKEGIVTIFTRHTTTGVRILEDERLLIEDLMHYMDRLVPSQVRYKHDNIGARDVPDHERINAYSHLRAFYSNSSEVVAIMNGELQLGKWQNIMFIDFDKSRRRRIMLTFMGNK